MNQRLEGLQQLNSSISYVVQTLRRHLEDAVRDAPDLDNLRQLRDRTEEIAKQINHYRRCEKGNYIVAKSLEFQQRLIPYTGVEHYRGIESTNFLHNSVMPESFIFQHRDEHRPTQDLFSQQAQKEHLMPHG